MYQIKPHQISQQSDGLYSRQSKKVRSADPVSQPISIWHSVHSAFSRVWDTHTLSGRMSVHKSRRLGLWITSAPADWLRVLTDESDFSDITSCVNLSLVPQSGQFSEDMIPTVGFNMRKITKGNVTIKVSPSSHPTTTSHILIIKMAYFILHI